MGAKKQNGRQKTKWPPKTKLSITQSILKLEAPDFAWYFILALHQFLPKNKMATKNKMAAKNKFSITQLILKLESPDLAW